MIPIYPLLPFNGLIFLGTAGTRFNVINQTRSSGGMVASIEGVQVAIDPGPGALVKICSLRPTVDPNRIEALFLTHRHIDHSGDFNVMAEAMTGGGRKPGGTIALPADAIDEEPVIYSYLQKRIGRIHRWSDGESLSMEGSSIEPIRLKHHGVECFGLKIHPKSAPPWGIISDTKYIQSLESFFQDCHTVIANTTLLERVDHIDHLAVTDVAHFIQKVKPARLFMTHFGGRILEGSPEDIATNLTNDATKVIAANDGLIIDLDQAKTR